MPQVAVRASRADRPGAGTRLSRVALAIAVLAVGLVAAASAAPAAAGNDWVDPGSPRFTSRTGSGLVVDGNGGQEAVIGERVRFVVSLRVSPHDTVYNGVIADALPAAMDFRSVSAAFSAVNDAPADGELPAGVVLNEQGVLCLGSAYTNETDDVQLFQLTTRGTVADIPDNVSGVVLENAATFRSTTWAKSPIPRPVLTADSAVTVIEPAPSLTIAADPPTEIFAGQDVSYTLTAANAEGSPPLYDTWVVNCLPEGLTFGSFAEDPAGAAIVDDGSGSNGCSLGQTRIAWLVGDLTASRVLAYSAASSSSVENGTSYDNSATLSGSSLDNDKVDPLEADIQRERTYVADAVHTVTVSNPRGADLAISMDLVGDLVAGSPATYTLTVHNNGPSDSGAVSVVDQLPGGVDFVSASGDGWTCAEVNGVVNCTRAGGLDPGETSPGITLVVDVPADRLAPITNSATVGGVEADPDPSNDTVELTVDTTAASDLAIEKHSVGRFVAGQEATYRLVVENFGPSSSSESVQITDVLPIGLSLVGSASIDGDWTCSAQGREVACGLDGPLPVGGEAIVDLVVAIDPDHRGNLHNEATVTATQLADPNPANNTDGDDSDSDAEADLAIESTHGDEVVAGTDVSYELSVDNAGPSASLGPIVVTDVLPQAMTYASAGGDGWDCVADDQTVTCTNADGVQNADSAPPIVVTASVSSDAGPAIIDNVVAVSGPEADPEPGNNTDHDATEVVDRANVSLTVAPADDGPVVAGLDTSFAITAENAGPSDADLISVTATVPDGLTAVAANGNGWTCTVGPDIVCSRDGIAAHADAPAITLDTAVDSSVAHLATLELDASISSSTDGDDPTDNTASATVEVTRSADLAVEMTYSGGEAPAGTEVAFEFAVRNAGPSDATAPITVVNTLPPGVTFTGSEGPWTCVAGPQTDPQQTVRCELHTDLAAGANTPSLGIAADIASGADAGVITNTAQVSSGAPDPEPANDGDTAEVTVSNIADVSIALAHGEEVRVGDTLDLTISVSNAGPSDARSVVVDEDLPTGLTLESATGANWDCDSQGDDVTCDRVGAVVAGAPVDPITVTARVQASAYPGVVNSASVTTSTPETDTTNNAASDAIEVPPLVDLTIAKRHPQPIRVGRNTGYRLTIDNLGPTLDPGPVTVTDVLPAGLTFVAADSLGWNCGHVEQTVTCVDPDGILVGDDSVIVLIVSVGPAALPQVTNSASVESAAEDANPANNTASDPAPVSP